MTQEEWEIVQVAATWSVGAGVVGLLVLWLMRARSMRLLVVGVGLAAICTVGAGVYGTANAMFLSDHDYEVTLRVLGVAGLVAAFNAAFVGFTLARSARTVSAQARKFGESGEFIAPSGGAAEFQRLANDLADTSRKLAQSREREKRLEGSRRELIGWVSHDLRTPLAGIRAMAEALEDGLAQDPGRYHRQIRCEVDRTVRMVDDLFDLSKIQAGSLELVLEAVAVRDLISEALASAAPIAHAKGVQINGGIDESLEVLADPGELTRALGNLLMNAIRHTPDEGVVEVRARRSGPALEISVSDGCGGLTDEELSRVFDVGWQGSSARTPEHGGVFGSGAGLGLAIVKGIVEAHEGSVAVSNRYHGCEFRVHLPIPA